MMIFLMCHKGTGGGSQGTVSLKRLSNITSPYANLIRYELNTDIVCTAIPFREQGALNKFRRSFKGASKFLLVPKYELVIFCR